MSLAASVEANIRGFAHKRSRTWPFVVEQLDASLWVVADKPRPKLRVREYFAVHGDVSATVTRIKRHAGREPFVLCVGSPAEGRDTELEDAYRSNGLRLFANEGLFVRRLPPRPRRTDRHDIRRVDSVESARALAKAARSQQLTEDEAAAPDADLRVHIAVVDGKPIGWCGSVRTNPTTAVAVDVCVDRNHRNRGIGKALMRALLLDDARRGITANHLAASRLGAKLYASVGYDHIGTLTCFRG
ncbi:MAG: GNAT family N-acetyltransferase [Planctomycetota bacterium]